MNFCISCTRLAHLHRVQCSNKMVINAPKLYEMQQNMSLESNGVDRARSQRKVPTRLFGMNFCISCTSSAHFAPSLVHSEMIPNAPKLYEMQQNMSLESNGVDRAHSQRKVPTRLRGMNFCIDYTSQAHFAPSLVQQRNGPKCTQTLRNTLKHVFGANGVDRARLQ